MTKSEKLQKIKKFCKDINADLQTDNQGQWIIYTNVYDSENENDSEEDMAGFGISKNKKNSHEDNEENELKVLKLLEDITPYDLKDGLDNSNSSTYSLKEIYRKFGTVTYTVYGELQEWQDNEVMFIFNFEDYNVFIKVNATYNSLSDYSFFKYNGRFDDQEREDRECNPYIVVRPEHVEKIEWKEIESLPGIRLGIFD